MSYTYSSDEDQTFVPKDLIPITLDKTTVYVYPKITADMLQAEKMYGLLVTKNSLESANVPIKNKLMTLGHLTDSDTIIKILEARLIQYTKEFIKQPGNFQIISYHSSNGKVIKNCFDTSNNNKDLKAFNKCSATNRRPDGISYAKLSCDIKFTDVDPSCKTIQPFTYFVRLNQETQTLKDDKNQDVEWTTFYGHGNWARSRDQAVVDTVMKNPRAIIDPFSLSSPDIQDNSADAQINIKSCNTKLESLALEAGWSIISNAVFRQICPNLDQDPIRVIQECKQGGTNAKGETYQLSVDQFFKAKNRLINFLPKTGDWSIDVTHDFISGLVKPIRDEVNGTNTTFKYNPGTAKKDAFSQISNLQKAYAAALSAETNQQNVTHKIQKEIKSTHAFMAQAHFSLADDTMKKHGKKIEPTCWGCKSVDHRYADRKGNILCPKANDPQVRAEAERCRQEYREKMKEKRNQRNQSFKAAVLKVFKESNGDYSDEPSKKKVKFSNLCLMTLLVANNNLKNAKPVLPINYNINLPHLALEVGDPEIFTFNMMVAFDSLAVLNVGNADYHMAIANRYPLAVKSLIWAKEEFSPLTLSGVVGNSSAEYKPTTELPAVIEYRLACKTKSGSSASFKVALGKHVAVNTILGFATIQAAKFSLDMDNEVVTSSVLDIKPLKVSFRPVRCDPEPDFSAAPASITTDSTIHHINVKDVLQCYNSTFNTDDDKKEDQKPVAAEVKNENAPVTGEKADEANKNNNEGKITSILKYPS